MIALTEEMKRDIAPKKMRADVTFIINHCYIVGQWKPSKSSVVNALYGMPSHPHLIGMILDYYGRKTIREIDNLK